MSDRQDTDPALRPVRGPGPAYPSGSTASTGQGQPPAGGPGYATGATAYGVGPATTPDYSPRPVAVRRPDVLAGLLLLLAAAAAAVSLVLRWLAGRDDTGLDLVRRGIDDAADGFGTVIDSGFWQPLVVVGGGAVLLVLGLLMLLPAKRHRIVGLIALLVGAGAAAAVLVPLVRSGWDPGTFDLGFWFAVAVGVLGLLGGLKALLTGRTYRQAHAVR